jgi:hypothetical protein
MKNYVDSLVKEFSESGSGKCPWNENFSRMIMHVEN